MSLVKLRQWAAREGVHYQAAWRCARLYGRRGAHDRALRAVTAVAKAGVDAAG